MFIRLPVLKLLLLATLVFPTFGEASVCRDFITGYTWLFPLRATARLNHETVNNQKESYLQLVQGLDREKALQVLEAQPVSTQEQRVALLETVGHLAGAMYGQHTVASRKEQERRLLQVLTRWKLDVSSGSRLSEENVKRVFDLYYLESNKANHSLFAKLINKIKGGVTQEELRSLARQRWEYEIQRRDFHAMLVSLNMASPQPTLWEKIKSKLRSTGSWLAFSFMNYQFFHWIGMPALYPNIDMFSYRGAQSQYDLIYDSLARGEEVALHTPKLLSTEKKERYNRWMKRLAPLLVAGVLFYQHAPMYYDLYLLSQQQGQTQEQLEPQPDNPVHTPPSRFELEALLLAQMKMEFQEANQREATKEEVAQMREDIKSLPFEDLEKLLRL